MLFRNGFIQMANLSGRNVKYWNMTEIMTDIKLNGCTIKLRRMSQGILRNFHFTSSPFFLQHTLLIIFRVNLRFELENEDEFNFRIDAAEVYRLHSETFLKYNYLIDTMTGETHHVTEEVKDRIMNFVLGHPFKLGPLRDPIEFLTVPAHVRFNSKYYLIPKLLDIPPRTIIERFKKKNYNIDLLNQLIQEVDKEYVRANHQIDFDSTLPFSGYYF